MCHCGLKLNAEGLCEACIEQKCNLCCPSIKQMSGLIKDFTDGKSMKEYMEELSDG